MSEPPPKPADRLDAENMLSATEQQIRRPGPRHAAAEHEQPPPPGGTDPEAASTPVVGAASNEPAAEDAAGPVLIWPAPNAVRLLAFVVDLLLIAIATVPIAVAVSGSTVLVAAALLLVFVVYHTASVWLTGGKTIGKALCNLQVGHLDRSAPTHDAAGLVWAFGRSSVGYLVVDVFGLGVLVAFRNPQRRCAHDYAFRSQVVTQVGQTDPQPRGRLAAALDRLRRFSDERETTLEEVKKKYLFLVRIWKWLIKMAASCLLWLLIVAHMWRSLVAKLSGHATASAPAKAMSAGKIAAVVSSTTIATTAGVVTAGAVYLSTSIVGDWGNPAFLRVERVGLNTYQATRLTDLVEPNSGCPVRKGQIVERFHGRGSHFTGTELWVQGANGQNCTYAWGPATADLLGNDTLRVCSTAPWGDHQKECDTVVRTPKH